MSESVLQKIRIPTFIDARGGLGVIENLETVPFRIQRVFLTYAPANGAQRGGHANRASTLAMINVAGQCTLRVFDGQREETLTLKNPMEGVLLPPMLWREIFDYSPDSVVLFLSDRHYSKSDYILDPSEFLAAVNGNMQTEADNAF